MIRHYLKVAFRNLLKYKTQNIISIIGLAVGLLCFCICMYCSRFVETTNHCFSNYTRIVELNLYDYQTETYFSGTQVALSEELRTWAMGEVEAISCMTYSRERSYLAEISEEKSLPYELETIEIDTLYNKVFTPQIVAGNWKTASRTSNAVILSESTAIKIFGKIESAIGKHLTLARRLHTSPESTPKTGGIVYTVQAVMKDIPLNNGFSFMTHTDAMVLNDSEGLFRSTKRHDMTGARTYVLLSPNTNIAELEQQFAKRNYSYTMYNQSYAVVANYISDRAQKKGAFVLGWVTGIVGTLILLVGLINFFHFLIGSFLNRTIILLILLCAAICLFVSVRIRRISIQTGIHGGVNKRRGKQWGRNLMLGIQFFICWIFVSFTVALFLQSEKTTQTLFHTLNQKEKEAILSIPLDYSFMKNEEKLSVVERFQQHAGVKDVLLADIAYTQGVSGNLLMTEKGNDNSWTDINIMCVPLNFFAFMNIPIEEGRTIRTKNDLVMDKVWQNKQKKNVIGMNFYDQNNDYTVCGVCTPFQTDVHYHSGGYAFMLYDPSEYVGHCYVKCYPEQQKEVVKWIEKIRREVLPENISYQVRTFQDDLYEIQAMEYMLKDTILFFAIVSIIITLLGVYSSITLDTERRQKEVAIRKVNGAGMSHIIWLFTRLYITLLMVTAALSFPLVYLVLQLWKQIYTVFFNCGFWFWTGIFISVAMITALTIWFRILKIARVNPVESIKNE